MKKREKPVIGIVSGGQLARMLAMAASRLGIEVVIYCQSKDECATFVTSRVVIGAYDDQAKLAQFAKMVDAVTCDWESIPAETLAILESLGVPVHPRSQVYAIAQDRLLEKRAAEAAGMTTARYAAFSTKEDLFLACVTIGFPAIAKTRYGGYDGKGQRFVHTLEEAVAAWDTFKRRPCILEGVVDFECEASIIVGRALDGQVVHFPMVRNEHDQGILRKTTYEHNAFGGRAGWAKAAEGPTSLAQSLEAVGLLAIELFVMKDGSVLFNEMAPRPHNSGHWTIEGCNISQFELLVRIMVGWPIFQPRSRHAEVTMENLLGPEADEIEEILLRPGLYLHLYEKPMRDGDPLRKRGHVTDISG